MTSCSFCSILNQIIHHRTKSTSLPSSYDWCHKNSNVAFLRGAAPHSCVIDTDSTSHSCRSRSLQRSRCAKDVRLPDRCSPCSNRQSTKGNTRDSRTLICTETDKHECSHRLRHVFRNEVETFTPLKQNGLQQQ